MTLDVSRELERLDRLKRDLSAFNLSPQREIPISNIRNVTNNISARNNEIGYKIKIAAIMDEFTFQCYSPECEILRVSKEKWASEIEIFNPEILFIESAWEGNDGQWKGAVAKTEKSLVDLVKWCRENNKPVIFWNKEDPIHFDTFLNTARMADYVFTTDADCIPRYKEELGTDNVFVLPFAAQPTIHNPIEKFERIDRFSFAGAYYTRYVERQKDLRTFTDVCLTTKGLDIYDRMLNNPDPRYTFPDEYKPFIVGTLKPDEIDKAYKGYKYGINMNSIKQSSTMFARRVFELIASNTLTISNYSCGVRNFFGDLVICTDSGDYLRAKFSDVVMNESEFDKIRLLGLRKVLSEHTYQLRLRYIISKVKGVELEDPLKEPITLLSLVNTDDEVRSIISQYNSMAYQNKILLLLTSDGYECALDLPDTIHILGRDSYSVNIDEVIKTDLVGYLDSNDHYGKYYLTDLRLGFLFYYGYSVGKGKSYSNGEGGISEIDGPQYMEHDGLKFRSSLLSLRRWKQRVTIEDFKALITSDANLTGLCVDRFNYCKNGINTDCTIVDDIHITDSGLDMQTINNISENLKASVSSIRIKIEGSELFRGIGKIKNDKIATQVVGTTAILISKMGEGEIFYINTGIKKSLTELCEGSSLGCYLDTSEGLGVSLVLYFFNKGGNRIGHAIGPPMSVFSPPIPDGSTHASIGFRINGGGTCSIRNLKIGPRLENSKAVLPKSSSLLLVNQYPSYDDLYRNGFVHRRVIEYKKKGHKVDVLKFHQSHKQECTEYRGISVYSGHTYELTNHLLTGAYTTVLVHFLDEEMWEVLEKFLGHVKIMVWIHGAEIQPWHRRDYNYSTEEEREKAKHLSAKRVDFWKKVFAINSENLHFIFVSKYFANEVMDDIGINLEPKRYSIIHNFIDTDLFYYQPKDPNQRFKILSIRPFASRKYANDLSVKTIIELSKRPIFNELQFLMIGDGPLFEETIEPIRNIKNVIIQRRFVPQEEIPSLHQQYGIFLVPTRMDSQGVSRDEAMSSGLIPVTNAVTAIPEFVDASCGILAPAEDYKVMAEGIESIVRDPEKFFMMSHAAADRVRRQSGINQTIYREIDLMVGSDPSHQ